MGNNSIINASSLDTNNLSLKLGNTSASGVIIGRAGQITDIQGNLRVAGSAGINGQVLTTNGTTAEWIDLPESSNGGWVGTALSDLNMNGRNISNVVKIDASGTSLTIGNMSSTNILIGKSGITTSFPGDVSMNIVKITGRSDFQDVSLNNLSVRTKASFSNDVYINNIDINGILKVGGSNGTYGQVLISNGTNAVWASPETYNLFGSSSNMNMGNINFDASQVDISSNILNINSKLLNVNGNASMYDVSINNLSVKSNATFVSDVSVNGYTQLNNVSSNNVSISNLSVKSNATFVSDVSVNGYMQLNNVSSNNVSIYNLSVKNNATFDNTVLITGQTTFNTPPHVPNPIYGNDAASKGYVDSLVGQYSGGYNLFFNYSVTDSTYNTFKEMSHNIVDTTQQQIDNVLTTAGDTLIAQFLTLPLGITVIPVGLWNTLIYGAVDIITDTITYYFTLSKKDLAGIETPLLTSANSIDINASPNNNPTAYNMNLTISTAIDLLLTDRIFIQIYSRRTGIAGGTITLRTYFQNNYYSFTQSTLNAGTTLLSSNNVWTGTNNYAIDIKSNNISSYSTGSINHNLWVDSANTDTINIGNTNISTVNLKGSIIDLSGTNVSINNANGRTTIGNILGNINIRGSIMDLSGTILGINPVNGRTIIGNTAGNVSVRGLIIDLSATNININTGGSAGTNGQALISNGTNTLWSTIPSFSGNNIWSGPNTFSATPYISTGAINTNSVFSIFSQPNYRKGFKNYISESFINYSSMVFYSNSTTYQECGSFEFNDYSYGYTTNGNMSITFNTVDIRNNVNIGTTTTTGITSNIINIGSSPSTTTTTINGATLNLNSTGGNVNIGTSGTGTINIGNATTTTLNIGEPMTPAYTYTATNGTNIVGTIGYILGSTGSTSNSTTAETTIRTIASLPIGVWLLTAGIRYGNALTWLSTSISTTNNVHDFRYGLITTGTGPSINAHNVNRITVVTTGTVTYYLISNSSANSTLTLINFQALRIA